MIYYAGFPGQNNITKDWVNVYILLDTTTSEASTYGAVCLQKEFLKGYFDV
jgi:hypothetical protein